MYFIIIITFSCDRITIRRLPLYVNLNKKSFATFVKRNLLWRFLFSTITPRFSRELGNRATIIRIQNKKIKVIFLIRVKGFQCMGCIHFFSLVLFNRAFETLIDQIRRFPLRLRSRGQRNRGNSTEATETVYRHFVVNRWSTLKWGTRAGSGKALAIPSVSVVYVELKTPSLQIHFRLRVISS